LPGRPTYVFIVGLNDLSLSIGAMAVEGCWRTLTRPGPLVDDIDPNPARGRAAFPRRQNLDGRVVGMDYRRAHDMGADHLGQWRDPPSKMAHPVGHYHAHDLDAFALEDLGLTIKRQAVVVLRDRYMGKEVRTSPNGWARKAIRIRPGGRRSKARKLQAGK
jgi:hypothetical protein